MKYFKELVGLTAAGAFLLLAAACGTSEQATTAVAEPAERSDEAGEVGSEESADTLQSETVADSESADSETGDTSATETGDNSATNTFLDAFLPGAPSFCYQLDQFSSVETPEMSGSDMLIFLVDFFSDLAKESEDGVTVELAQEGLDFLKPAVDALEKAGGDEDKALEYMGPEVEAALEAGLDDLFAQWLAATALAAGECRPFLNEDAQQAAGANTSQIDRSTSSDDVATTVPVDEAASTGVNTSGEVAVRIEQISESNLISVDLNSVADEYAELVVDSAYSTNSYSDSAGWPMAQQPRNSSAGPGNKLVVIDLQLRSRASGNMSDTALRLVDSATGAIFGPMTTINMAANAGTIVNAPILFEVPADLTQFQLQGGALDGDRDGYQATFDIQLESGDISSHVPTDVTFAEGPAQAAQVSQDNLGNSLLDKLGGKYTFATINVSGGQVSAKIEGDAAPVGYKWLTLDVQIIGEGALSVVNESSLRLVVGDEWYPSLTNINAGISNGGVWSGSVVFEIPAAASEATLAFGMPTGWVDIGELAEFRIDLP